MNTQSVNQTVRKNILTPRAFTKGLLRPSRAPRTHPNTRGLCYLRFVHPSHWKIAKQTLGFWPRWTQVKTFAIQLAQQSTFQLECLVESNLDFSFENNRLHFTRGRIPALVILHNNSLPPLIKVGGKSRRTLVPLKTLATFILIVAAIFSFGKLANHINQQRQGFSNPLEPSIDASLDPTLACIALLTVTLQSYLHGKRVIWRPNIALTCTLILTFRFLQTGHALTCQREGRLEPTWLLTKIFFFLSILPLPRKLFHKILALFLWNVALQTFAAHLNYNCFCSLIDANLPYNLLRPEDFLASPEQVELVQRQRMELVLLSQRVTEAYAT